jgi:hypothetical protein
MNEFNSDKEKIQHAIATIKLRFQSGIVTNELEELLYILETPVKPATADNWEPPEVGCYD